MSFKNIIACTVVSSLCVVMALPQVLHSTTMVKMSESDLAIDADVIIQGKVTSTWSEWGENGRYIYTYGTVTASRMIKGNLIGNSQEFIVKRPGGTIGEATMEVPSAPQFRVGEELILFLLDDISSHESNVLGWEQGVFNVRDGVVVQNGKSADNFIAELQSYILNTR